MNVQIISYIYDIMNYFHYTCFVNFSCDMMQNINRLKILLVEKNKINKWLGEQLKVNPTTVSKWCINSSRPSLKMFFR